VLPLCCLDKRATERRKKNLFDTRVRCVRRDCDWPGKRERVYVYSPPPRPFDRGTVKREGKGKKKGAFFCEGREINRKIKK
jgi:hypothetical protein